MAVEENVLRSKAGVHYGSLKIGSALDKSVSITYAFANAYLLIIDEISYLS